MRTVALALLLAACQGGDCVETPTGICVSFSPDLELSVDDRATAMSVADLTALDLLGELKRVGHGVEFHEAYATLFSMQVEWTTGPLPCSYEGGCLGLYASGYNKAWVQWKPCSNPRTVAHEMIHAMLLTKPGTSDAEDHHRIPGLFYPIKGSLAAEAAERVVERAGCETIY